MKVWFDKNDMQILPGDMVKHDSFGEVVRVIEDEEKNLYLGGYDKPFSPEYQLNEHWTVLVG